MDIFSKSQPKQYLDLFDGKSLFEMPVERNTDLADHLMVVWIVDNCYLSKQVLDKAINYYTSIIESASRNTAAGSYYISVKWFHLLL